MAPALEDLLAKELSTLSTAAEVVDDDVNIKLIGDRVNELDAALVELDCSAATDERGMRAVLRHMVPTSYFLAFMFDEHSIENLMFYLDIVHFRREILATGDQAKWRETALSIFYCYIKKGAPLELNLVSSVQNALQNALSPEMLKGDCESLKTVYDDAFEACRILMQDTWRRYQRSEIFQKSTRRLTGADLTDVKVRRAAMREVLYHFRNVVGVPDTYTTIVKGKVLAYYRRLNAGNSSIDLEAQSIIDSCTGPIPNVMRVKLAYEPGPTDKGMLRLAVNELVLVLEENANGVWKGQNCKGVGLFRPVLCAKVELPTFDEVDLVSTAAPLPVTHRAPIASLLPTLLESLTRSGCTALSNVSPVVGSRFLHGLAGVTLAVTQAISLADALSSRTFQFRDIQILHHESLKTVEHLKSLTNWMCTVYDKGSVASRKNDPNHLSLSSVARLLSVLLDVLQATKELLRALRPLLQSFVANPKEFDVENIIITALERITVLNGPRSIKNAQQLVASAASSITEASRTEDTTFFLRSTAVLCAAVLMFVDCASDAEGDETVGVLETAVASVIGKVRSARDSAELSLLMDRSRNVQATAAVGAQISAVISQCVRDLEACASKKEASGKASHALVEAELKVVRGGVSTLLAAVQQNRKDEFVGCASQLSEAAKVLVIKVHSALSAQGVVGIKLYDEVLSDAGHLVDEGAGFDDPHASYEGCLKELTSNILAVLPQSSDQLDIRPQQQAGAACSSAVRMILQILQWLLARASRNADRLVLSQSATALQAARDAFEAALQDNLATLMSVESTATLKQSCAGLLQATKDAGQAIADFSKDGGSPLPEQTPASPPPQLFSVQRRGSSQLFGKSKPVSPFDSAAMVDANQPISPFDPNRRGSVPAPSSPPTVMDRRASSSAVVAPARSRTGSVTSLNARSDAKDPIKVEVNLRLAQLLHSVGKARVAAALAAGVWPPPTAAADIQSACQAVTNTLTELTSSFDAVLGREQDRKVSERGDTTARWKLSCFDLQAYTSACLADIVPVLAAKQASITADRRTHQLMKRAKFTTPSKYWVDKGAKVDYTRFNKLCTPESLEDTEDDAIVEAAAGDAIAVRAGSLKGLVRILCNHKYFDIPYMQTFLMTYRTFTTPMELLNALIERYGVAPPLNFPHEEFYYVKKIVVIRAQVPRVIHAWLDASYDDLKQNDGEVLVALKEFLEQQMSVTDEGLAAMLLKQLASLESGANHRPSMSKAAAPPAQNKNGWSGPDTRLGSLNALEVARQLTLIDFNLFAAIRPSEFLQQAWSKEALKDRAPNIRALVRRSNDLTYFVASELLKEGDLARRQALLLHVIHIAIGCLSLNNFNAVMSIYAALSSSPLFRLKKTWASVLNDPSSAVYTAWQRIEQLTAPANNHSAYRTALRAAKPPCVPFLGLVLTDLVYLDDGNSDNVVVNNHALINFEKRRKTYAVIAGIQQMQSTPYGLTQWPDLMQLLLRHETSQTEDAALYRRSLEIEPRE